MANQTLTLNHDYVTADMTVTVAGVDYVVGSDLTVSVPDSVTQEQIDALGAIVLDPANLVPLATPFIQSFAGISASNTATKQALFTVPATKSCVITGIVIRGASAELTSLTLGFGFDSGASDVSATGAIPDTLASATDLTRPVLVDPAPVGAAGQAFGVKCGVSGGSNTFKVDVSGYYF